MKASVAMQSINVLGTSYVATKSSLAQLRVCVTEDQRQHRREADWEQKRQKQAVTRDAYRAAIEQKPGWFLDIKSDFLHQNEGF